MKQFLEPELQVELFRVEDIVTNSIPSISEEDPTPGPNGGPIG